MREKEFFELLREEKVPFETWNKPASALLREVRDGVKLYRGFDGLLRFAESVWIIASYFDLDTQTEWTIRERHREFLNGEIDVRSRTVFDPQAQKHYPVAISETLKGYERGRDKIFATALRALKEEAGYVHPSMDRLSFVSVGKPVYTKSKAFAGITSATVAHVCRYDITTMEWNEWASNEWPSTDEDGIITVLEKVELGQD